MGYLGFLSRYNDSLGKRGLSRQVWLEAFSARNFIRAPNRV